MRKHRVVCSAALAATLSACTLQHSKVAIPDGRSIPIASDARFVTTDDSGLAVLGLLVVSEPDHYAVLLERMRRRYKCTEIHHAQLDFYSDFWLFVSFPIARITAICDQKAGPMEMPAVPVPPAPAPPTPATTTPATPSVPPPLGPPTGSGGAS